MILYPNGIEAKVHDRVAIAHGACRAVGHAVIDTPEQQRSWGLEEETGLMLESLQYGLVFQPTDTLVADEIEFVSRASDESADEELAESDS